MCVHAWRLRAQSETSIVNKNYVYFFLIGDILGSCEAKVSPKMWTRMVPCSENSKKVHRSLEAARPNEAPKMYRVYKNSFKLRRPEHFMPENKYTRLKYCTVSMNNVHVAKMLPSTENSKPESRYLEAARPK
jgi:hypothetical protein